MQMKTKAIVFLCMTVPFFASCTYIQSLSKQEALKRDLQNNPSKLTEKRLINRDTFFVYGRILENEPLDIHSSLAVVALSSQYQLNEVVDSTPLGKVDSFYGLNLPSGDFQLLVFADSNLNGIYESHEAVGSRFVSLSLSSNPNKIVSGMDIEISNGQYASFESLSIPVASPNVTRDSLFYPKGTIRSLSDPIFSSQMSVLGMYDPAAFMEVSPMMFYALEEDSFYKIPVIFVHGMAGTTRSFEFIVNALDRTQYKPWFFYYPSGTNLNQTAQMFYDIFLSGELIEPQPYGVIIVAHSMGGLVVREALNLYKGNETEIPVASFVSIASPFGGMSSVELGINNAPLVVPSWHSLRPNGEFIRSLFRNPIPETFSHYLLFAYENEGDSTDSDGVVSVNSQLAIPFINGFADVQGFNTTHSGILSYQPAIDRVISLIEKVKSNFPADHLEVLAKGGFSVPLSDLFSPIEKFIIETMGIYMQAIEQGTLQATPFNQQFLDVIQKNSLPETVFDTAWKKFRDEYPEPIFIKDR